MSASSAENPSRRPLRACRRLVQELIGGALCIGLAACSTEERGAPFDTARPNVVLVSIDTLRADHLSTYGYFRDTSPFLTRLAADGFLFQDAVTVMSHTLPTHVSLFTGVHPLSHEVLSNAWVFSGGFPTLADRFRELGYATAGFVGGIPLNEGTGVGRGFETWVDTGALPGEPGEGGEDPYKLPGERVNARVRDWLATVEPGRPVFLFVHYFDVHEPWELPPDDPGFPGQPLAPWMDSVGITSERIRDVSPVAIHVDGEPVGLLVDALEAYDASIRLVDRHLEELVGDLRAAGRLERAFLAVAADHGEGLGQHELFSHGLHLYEEQVRIPLVVRLFGSAWPPRRVGGPVSILDLYPTLLEVVGAPPDPVLQGRSLVPLLAGDDADPERGLLLRRRSFREISFKRRGREYASDVPLQVLRTGRWKYFLSADGAEELYDLESDPHELSNVVDADPERVARLRAELVRLQRRYTEAARGGAAMTSDEHLLEGLGKLGYVGYGDDEGSARDDGAGGEGGDGSPDGKDGG